MKEKLMEAGLEHLIPVFEEERIGFEELRSLISDSNEYKKLFPRYGDRIKLNRLAENVHTKDNPIQDSYEVLLDIPLIETLNEENSYPIPELPEIIKEKEVACEPPTKKRKEVFNLNELLNSCRTRQAILALYNCKKELDSACQSYLVDIIVHFLNIEPFRYVYKEIITS
ncbi:PREDICTED: uncharacterized protein LOC105462828 [Wasmannia auropunctata]|uniref:uncharacterized protein LOC105462828 n=1 Tax=Wasmannia auropunctata TaxID=64793 RepID=UPI0005EF0339|nr:PREDICTED: uncharacterized protein LOC105462828 [Wasmannia auropunctata]